MTPTDELIAALRAFTVRNCGVLRRDEFALVTEAADRLASLTAPVGEWETTAEERKNLVRQAEYEPQHQVAETSLWLHWREILPRLIRDLDRALALLSAERAARKEADRIGARKAEQYAAERDQNKRLVEALETTLRWAESRCPCENEEPNPCPLCGASIENLEGCKSAENTLPRWLLEELRTVAARSARAQPEDQR
jgi:hypothetical protein